MPNTVYLTPAELSGRYRQTIGVRTLANWRAQGLGPAFVKVGGRVLYTLAAVAEWEAARVAENIRAALLAAVWASSWPAIASAAMLAPAACRPL